MRIQITLTELILLSRHEKMGPFDEGEDYVLHLDGDLGYSNPNPLRFTRVKAPVRIRTVIPV